MTPPVATADCNAPNVQLAAVPFPTTVVGLDVLAACPSMGTPVLHEPLGLPACVPPSEAAPDELPLFPLLPPLPELEPDAEPELEPLAEPEPALLSEPELEALLEPMTELAPPLDAPLEAPLPPPSPPPLAPELLPQSVNDTPPESATKIECRNSALTVGLVMMRITIAPDRPRDHHA
jgi:hypothetical protein